MKIRSLPAAADIVARGEATVDSEAALRAIVPAASAAVQANKLTRLDPHAARLTALSQLVGLAMRDDDERLEAGLRAGGTHAISTDRAAYTPGRRQR